MLYPYKSGNVFGDGWKIEILPGNSFKNETLPLVVSKVNPLRVVSKGNTGSDSFSKTEIFSVEDKLSPVLKHGFLRSEEKKGNGVKSENPPSGCFQYETFPWRCFQK